MTTLIGRPVDRVDGPLKVTGRATYTWERWDLGQPLYGFIVCAGVGRGRVTRIDASRAAATPGVRRVLTHLDVPRQGAWDLGVEEHYLRAWPVLAGPEITSFGQPVALVVADAFEQARDAAGLVDVTYERTPGRFDLEANAAELYRPDAVNAGLETDTVVGDLASAFDGAEVKIDALYTTPYHFSMPMEPNACLAAWDGDHVTVCVSSQVLAQARVRIASTVLVDPEQVQVLARFVGGGFGSKLGVHAEAIFAVLASRLLGEPVKVAMTRQQLFQLVGSRPATRQRVRLGAGRDGRLVAFGHEATVKGSYGADFVEQTATVGRGLYAAPHRLTTHRVIPLDLPFSEDVRAPGEASGLLAVESAMDELAHALEIDPVELRILNEPARHPETGQSFSERRLVECLREGARRFGWERRPKVPGSRREGRWLVGYGMSAAIRPQFQMGTSVRVRLGPDGVAVVESDMTDIGGGTYTILAQVVADGLGLPLERVRVELGQTDYPAGAGSGASWGASNAGNAANRACRALVGRLLDAARLHAMSPLHGRDPAGAVVADGRISVGDASDALTDIVARSFPAGLDAVGSVPDMQDEPGLVERSVNCYGAHFAEVGVDADTGEVRLRRMLGVYAAGRVLNPKTARSQLIGGMIWGLSSALHEAAVVDPRSGAFVNRDFAEYLVPVHADVPDVDAIVLDGFDRAANELGVKGMGELGISGSGAAVANAVFNATGVRVRDFPITLDQLLPRLPAMTT